MSHLIVVNRSRFGKDHSWKDRNKAKVSRGRDKSEETITRTATIQTDEKNKHELNHARGRETNTIDDQTPKSINRSPRNDDLTATQVREKFNLVPRAFPFEIGRGAPPTF